MKPLSRVAYTVLSLPHPNEIGAKEFLKSIVESICDTILKEDNSILKGVSIEFLADKNLYCELVYEYHLHPAFVKNSSTLIEFEDFGFRFKMSAYFGDFGPIVFPGIPFTVEIAK